MTGSVDIDDIDFYQRKINTLRPFSKEMAEQLREFYRIGLTYSSNAIEGNSLTISETKVVLEDGITIGGKPLKDHLEALGHSNAFKLMWELVNKTGKDDFSEEDIKNLHSHLFYRLNPEEGGNYRKIPVIVSGSSYVFPEPERVPVLMERFINEIREIKKKNHPVVYASKVHRRLVQIHPFFDGNGRTARLLMNVVLFKAGYPVTIIPPVRRVEYIASLEKSHVTDDDKDFIDLILSCIKESQRELLRFFHIDIKKG